MLAAEVFFKVQLAIHTVANHMETFGGTFLVIYYYSG